ncbi:hypothetical protein D3C87_931650 [compost metagenome]
MNTQEEVTRHLAIGESYKGWEIPYCGLGKVTCRKGHQEFHVYRGLEYQTNWMESAWLEAKAKIDEIESR